MRGAGDCPCGRTACAAFFRALRMMRSRAERLSAGSELDRATCWARARGPQRLGRDTDHMESELQMLRCSDVTHRENLNKVHIGSVTTLRNLWSTRGLMVGEAPKCDGAPSGGTTPGFGFSGFPICFFTVPAPFVAASARFGGAFFAFPIALRSAGTARRLAAVRRVRLRPLRAGSELVRRIASSREKDTG